MLSDTLSETRPGDCADHPRSSPAGRALVPLANPLSPAGALAAIAASDRESSGVGRELRSWAGRRQKRN